jgi:hypothetical protein
MSSIILSVDVERTSLVCNWTLVSNTHFDTITGQVLTYTDLSHNSWISQQVSSSDTPDEYTEVIRGLDEATDYKVYVTVIGKKTVGGVTSRVVKTSNVVYKRTGVNKANPDFTLLSGKDYLQVVFWEPGQIPTATYNSPAAMAYNFATSDIQPYDITSFIISVNNLDKEEAEEETGTSLRSFEVSDVETYAVTDPNGYTYTYKYILIENLQESSNYEIAVTYLTESDILPILDLSATKIQETKEGTTLGQAASYALNTRDASGNVGVNLSIDVVWRAPETRVVTGNDTQADIPPASSSIQRQIKNGLNWVDDEIAPVSFTELQDVNGNYKRVDTTSLVVGSLYRYNIDLKNADGVIIISTQTNEVRALKKIAATLAAENIKLDASNGDVWFEANVSNIFTFDSDSSRVGGFDLPAEFANRVTNDQFRLKYTIDGGAPLYKPITIGDGIATSTKIARTEEKSITVALEVNPSHETTYYPTAVSDEYTAISRSLVTSEPVTLFNTTLPGDVTNFVYTNTEASDANQGSNKIRLTWSSTDSALNPNAKGFYIATVTNDDDAEDVYTVVLAPPGATLSEYPDTYDLRDHYTGTTNLSYELARTIGNAYTATIQRVYIYTTVTLAENANVVGSFLNGAINNGGEDLIQFLNPPVPVVSGHNFNDSNNVLTFNVAHEEGTYGFANDDTYFEITLTKAGVNQTITVVPGEGTNGAGDNSINMSSIGSSGDTFTLHVRAYVTTKYESTSAVTKSFYSVGHTFEFRKLSGLAAPTNVISYKNTGADNDGTHMKIAWTGVTNAVAQSFDTPATIYYLLEVIDSGSNSEIITLLSPDHMNSDGVVSEARKTILFGSNDLPANRDRYVKDTLTNFSYIYTECVVGHSYTYSITARYFAPDIANYVVSELTETGRALRAVGELPAPVALIDVQTDGTKFNFEMAYNAPNNSGLDDEELTFEYIELNKTSQLPTGSAVDLDEGENPNVSRSSFSQTIAPGDIIPVGFRTYYYTFANSTDEEETKYTSDLISNFDINPVKFTFLPQIKTIRVSYGEGTANIAVTYEKNGNKFGELHAVTQWMDTNDAPHLLGVHDEDTSGNHTAADTLRNDDHTYTFALSDVQEDGVTFVSLAGHVALGLVVAHMTNNGGLIAGTYVPEALYSTNFVIQG